MTHITTTGRIHTLSGHVSSSQYVPREPRRSTTRRALTFLAGFAVGVMLASALFVATAEAQMRIDAGWMQSAGEIVAVDAATGETLAVADRSVETPYRFRFIQRECADPAIPGSCEPCAYFDPCVDQLGGAYMELPDRGEPYPFVVRADHTGATRIKMMTDLRRVISGPGERLALSEPQPLRYADGDYHLRTSAWWTPWTQETDLRVMLDSIHALALERMAQIDDLREALAEAEAERDAALARAERVDELEATLSAVRERAQAALDVLRRR